MSTASLATRRNRFLVALRQLPLSELRTRLDNHSPDEFCLIAALDDRVIGGARYVRQRDSGVAEIAVTVHDEFQRQGLGTALLARLLPVARRHGIRRLVGEALNENRAVVSLFSRFGPLRVSRTEPGVRHLELDLDRLRG